MGQGVGATLDCWDAAIIDAEGGEGATSDYWDAPRETALVKSIELCALKCIIPPVLKDVLPK